ncbi:MAG: DUF2997 domain-containing protein [Deltaproteobacteria bacterium]|nr:DUF2997 domain-containing protein [Deltaproteobacteria bacterium]
MIREEIEVVVDEEGHASVHVKGVKGKTCNDLTADLEKALGKVTKRMTTREAYEVPLETRRCARH